MDKVNVHINRSSIYNFLYKRIKEVVSHIEENQFEKAENTYVDMVNDVSNMVNENV